MVRITGISVILVVLLAISELVLIHAVPGGIKGETYCLFRVFYNY